jgi:hypothetical protein
LQSQEVLSLLPFAQSSSGINGSGGPISLNIVNEQDGDEKDLSQGNAIIEGEYILQVSTF